MSRSINFYPTFDDNHYISLNPVIKYNFFYYPNDKNDIEEIDSTITSNKFITLSTEKNHWDCLTYDLYMKINVEIINGDVLYGREGICPTNGEISLGLEWFSKKSKKRGWIIPNKNNNIRNDETKQNFIFECKFDKNTFLYDIEINLVLFNSRSDDKVDDSEIFLNNQTGVMFGYLDSKVLFMTGTGSLFPIYVNSVNDNKLWHLEIDCNEPENDKLSDCVKLILNSNHKDFKLLDTSSKHYCERLVFEIVANAVTILICHLKENGFLDNLNGTIADGSILHFVKYYKENLGLNIDNVNSISTSLREYLDDGGK